MIAYIGVGSNLGDSEYNCRQAIALLAGSNMQLQVCSSFYRSEPVGYSPQPHFINAVVRLQTELSANDLLVELKAVEKRLGKDIKEKWGPRTIDLDILLYDNLIIDDDDLHIPHPRMHMRSFVLMPMLELDPQLIHPVLGISIKELLDKLEKPTECIKVK